MKSSTLTAEELNVTVNFINMQEITAKITLGKAIPNKTSEILAVISCTYII